MVNVTILASEVEVEICMPRMCGRQTNRTNINTKDLEHYYKIYTISR